MILRPYQITALADVQAKIHDRPVCVMPTGSGKTVVAAHLILQHQGPVLFVAHRRELILQCQARLAALGISSGAILAGVDPSPSERVQVGSIQTLARRDRPPAALLIIDEAHHAVGDSYLALLEAYPSASVVGLTATPFRLDGRGLGEVFRSIVVGTRLADLIKDGTLIGPKIFTTPTPVAIEGIKKTAGDFNLAALGLMMNTKQLVGDLVEHWKKHAPARTVVYAVDIAHSRAIEETFQAAGIPCEHLDGKTDTDTRAGILGRLRSGTTRVVTNCMVLTEGWDLPALDCAVIARPTASLCLHLQMLGRVMRTAEGKTGALVLDHAGNVRRLGKPDQFIDYTLDGKIRASSESFATCPACGVVTDENPCPECGHVREAPEQKQVEHVDGELVEVDAPPTHEDQSAVFDAIEQIRLAYGFKEGWAAHRFKARFGAWPVVVVDESGLRRLCDPCSGEDRARVYKDLLGVALERGFRRGWAAHQYRARFAKWPRFSADTRERLGIDDAEEAVVDNSHADVLWRQAHRLPPAP